MIEPGRSERRRQFCGRCGQLMFEYYRSPDGHFGLVKGVDPEESPRGREVRCPTCGARYRLLDRVDAMGQPVVRKSAVGSERFGESRQSEDRRKE
jgi:DNA-directed RNA polymerase subunit RPC12/RpoP